jgi:hypothetical protein
MSETRDHISPSALEQFSCRLQWFWGNKKKYRPSRINSHLELGTGVHEALEKYYSSGADPIKAFTKWATQRAKELTFEADLQTLSEIRSLGMAMLDGYMAKWVDEPFRVITTEHECTRPLTSPKGKPTNCDVLVRVDAVVEDTRLHQLFVLEHKTFTYFNPSQMNRDHQFAAEVFVASPLAEKLDGRPLTGLIYNGLRKQIPSMRTKLDLFERHYIGVNTHQIAAFLKRAYWTYLQMSDPKLPIFPQPNNVRCNQCAFKDPCEQYMIGGDYRFILNHSFELREGEKNYDED